ncbi:nicotinate-nucleotide--dimethylbenzimidazole phosphoribosyltransferase [Fulvivirgaceae bacterium BMA12]|uniref:Nicotinate-nucleotide--dimethylbenzimidazole phosphoribosyltransferase n=1 Tax=Agaribacillus aureus TaxID=3051825 RepID=A0ABT8L387_9BACT|nr:nicotinate-nucleotide--dimethylbenzimidazole phosphoribosyltransferase [Fulvivirgaceae bacterium BMA12]
MGYKIFPPKKDLLSELIEKVNGKTKPVGALGRLEQIAIQIGLIQQSLSPVLNKPYILVFAGDHGIAREGVSAYPQAVTHQMVNNFLSGKAAINVFARQNAIGLKVIDAGVNYDFDPHVLLTRHKVDYGTRSFLHEKAMTKEQLQQALDYGEVAVDEIKSLGANIVGFGEMGIGNTASASMIMSRICGLELIHCVGRGTGLNDVQLQNKFGVLRAALDRHADVTDPLEVLQTFGGYEIAQMCGAMLRAAELQMVLLIDGFIATAAFLVAQQLCPAIKAYSVLCHQSEEKGHQQMVDFLKMKPLINLNMRLGEGTGCAVAYPIVNSAITFFNEMASFTEAGVSNRIDQ